MPGIQITTEVRQAPRRDLVHIAALDERLDQLSLDQLVAALFDVPQTSNSETRSAMPLQRDFIKYNNSTAGMHSDWHPQDWILIVEAISEWDMIRDAEDARAYRARELQAEIAAMHGFDDIVDFVEQSEEFLPARQSDEISAD